MSSAGGVGVLLNDGFVKLGYDCFARVGHALKDVRHRDSSTWILQALYPSFRFRVCV